MINYLHWRKFDWTYDSICPDCLRVIAHADDETGLAALEEKHVCDPAVRARQFISTPPPLTNAPPTTPFSYDPPPKSKT
jgi:hypothetical protein